MAELKVVADTILASASCCCVSLTPQPTLSHAFFSCLSRLHMICAFAYTIGPTWVTLGGLASCTLPLNGPKTTTTTYY